MKKSVVFTIFLALLVPVTAIAADSTSYAPPGVVQNTNMDRHGTAIYNASGIQSTGTIHSSDMGAPGQKNILVGDDLYLSDVDQANTVGVYGNQDPNHAKVIHRPQG